MKERLLVLAKACPEASKKYEALVCVAGLTDKGEWRRIYPIPWEAFWKNSATRFRKKHWIEYELESDKPSDHRPESRRIKFQTIKELGEASYGEIKKLLEPRVRTIEEIEAGGTKAQSLGVVRPRIIDFLETDNAHYEELVSRKKQETLFGTPAIPLEIPKYKYRYVFTDGAECRKHELLCEDWEVGELYRKCEACRKAGKYKDEAEVHAKVRQRMLDGMRLKGDVYFIVGSHFRFNTFIVVGVVYPRKGE